MGTNATKWMHWTALIVLVVVAIELMALAAGLAMPRFFDRRDDVLSQVTEESLAAFRANASPPLGWLPAVGRRTEPNCVGQPWTATVTADRRRAGAPSAPDGKVAVLVAGDSYTFGAEVDDQDTYPAKLETLLGVGIANLGVSAYDPLQATLRLEQELPRYPDAKVLVLGIMYENLLRLQNSFRPVYTLGTTVFYGFKPYIRHGVIQGVIRSEPWRDVATATAAIVEAFDTDFWAKPRLRFPFARSFLQAFATNDFWFRLRGAVDPMLGLQRQTHVVNDPEIRQNLAAVLQRFGAISNGRELHRLVVLIPQNGADFASADLVEAMVRDASPPGLRAIGLGDGVDAAQYNLRRGRCHPSPYGYAAIARAVAAALRDIVGSDTRAALPR